MHLDTLLAALEQSPKAIHPGSGADKAWETIDITSLAYD